MHGSSMKQRSGIVLYEVRLGLQSFRSILSTLQAVGSLSWAFRALTFGPSFNWLRHHSVHVNRMYPARPDTTKQMRCTGLPNGALGSAWRRQACRLEVRVGN